MESRITLDIVEPERFILREEVDEVRAPGGEGDFGVLPGHCEFLSTLREGEVIYRIGTQEHRASIAGGFAEVSANRVIILADSPRDKAAKQTVGE